MSDHTMPPISGPGVGGRAQESVDQSGESSCTVLIHNDDVTPFEYVNYMLCSLFMVSEEIADHIAWTAHTTGQAVVVSRPRTEAVNLVRVANGRARDNGYPLTFTLDD